MPKVENRGVLCVPPRLGGEQGNPVCYGGLGVHLSRRPAQINRKVNLPSLANHGIFSQREQNLVPNTTQEQVALMCYHTTSYKKSNTFEYCPFFSCQLIAGLTMDHFGRESKFV